MKRHRSLIFRAVFLVLTCTALARVEAGETTGFYVEEYWQLKPGKTAQWLDYYRRVIYPVAKRIPGYQGWTVMSIDPLRSGATDEAKPPAWLTIGPPPQLQVPHPGMQTAGVRTDSSTNLHALLRGHFQVIITHRLADAKALQDFIPVFEKIWAREHDGENVWDHLSTEFFSMVDGHWDVIYRGVEETHEFTAR